MPLAHMGQQLSPFISAVNEKQAATRMVAMPKYPMSLSALAFIGHRYTHL